MAKLNHLETLHQIESLRNTIQQIEQNLYAQIPQGLLHEFDTSKEKFLNWVEEIEVLLVEYSENNNH